MFIGHYGIALAGKKLAPRVSLGTAVLAAQFLDLLWPFLLFAGLEQVRIAPGVTLVNPLDFTHYPISHSLLTALGWSAGFALVYWAMRREAGTALILGAAVASHWALDFLLHRPDLPLWPGGPAVGLGLWNSLAASAALELGIFTAGLLLYLKGSKARDGVGRWGLAALVVVLLAIFVSSLKGTPPPSVRALQWTALGQWLFVGWAYWIGRRRETSR